MGEKLKKCPVVALNNSSKLLHNGAGGYTGYGMNVAIVDELKLENQKVNMEHRHAPPGVNSRSETAAQSAADLEVLREIEHIYFSPPSEFDAARYALEHAPSPPDCEAIDRMFTKLKRQQQ
ncbi:jg22275, partial [Pararge aegeria aegeria]